MIDIFARSITLAIVSHDGCGGGYNIITPLCTSAAGAEKGYLFERDC